MFQYLMIKQDRNCKSCSLEEDALENKIVLVLMQLKGISRKTIIRRFALDPDMDCDIATLRSVIEKAGIEDRRIKNISDEDIKSAIDKAEEIIEQSSAEDIHIVTYLNREYPERLRYISDPPTILYYKGNISCLNEMHAVAIIGTREPTGYGIKIARNLGSSFGKRDYVVVSGLAIGCDMYGHEGCLDEHGRTIAVMPCGLDKVYPASNKSLASKILETGGGLISEYPVKTKVFKNLFVERDRLQSGLSDGVLVVETGEWGGTMHTVNYTLDYKRILACYCHPDKYLSEPKTFGNQKLIREGKAMAIGNNDQLEEFRKKMEENKVVTKKIEATQNTIFDYMNK